MQRLSLNEIRERYLSFFESKGHLRLPSFSLVPHGDASLLLINAGMAPLKPYFTGKETPPRKRVTTCQKCIRTPDIERVGKTARHGTFFEMLGNFSFGDYFKREAIAWAWEFVTQDLKIPADRLWVSIYEEDEQAFDIWTKEVGVDPSRIVRMGKEDNFWEIGTGPCGPCSELYFDRGPEHGCGKETCCVGCDCDRYVEFWNLVFTQFDKDENGVYHPLAHPNIDTGMGLERIACIMQGVNSLFEVDTVRNIMLKISEAAGVKYGSSPETDVSLRVITDHIRSTTFMVSDGILPSNEGRGYVLRRLLRRAARHGKLLGIKDTFLSIIAQTVIDESAAAYPELAQKADYIKKVIKIEEERFNETIDAGLGILEQYIAELKAAGISTLSGEKAFKLYDTYGFPIDLTVEILGEQGMGIDRSGFDREMELQRDRARAARQAGEGAGWDDNALSKLKNITSEFLGYELDRCSASIIALLSGNEVTDGISAGDEGIMLLDKTVFYGESGGQVGDTGRICKEGASALVTDCKKTADGKYLHHVKVESGAFRVGDAVAAEIDTARRAKIRRNHSATHLLQRALRDTLGTHVEQAGSQVTPERLRFDFTHFSAMTKEQLMEVEQAVNNAILASLPVEVKEMPLSQARKLGAMALFGEKYGETVRVVKMGDYSIELCGGTHLSNTSQAGLFKIISESGVAAGVRRIEAVTGEGVLAELYAAQSALESAAAALKTSPADIVQRAEHLTDELRSLQKELDSMRAKLASGAAEKLLKDAEEVNGIKVIAAKFEGMDINALRKAGDTLRDKAGSAVVVLAGVNDGKLTFVAMATKDAVAKGAHAGNIIREVAKIAGGGGGGKPESAQAGGKNPEKADQALGAVLGLVRDMIK